MRQVIQYQKTGELKVAELPAPQCPPDGVLVRNAWSLISAGTERVSVDTARASMLGKARSRPDLVKQVLDNARREGALATYRKVQNRLDNYKELGYSSAGVVVESASPGLRPGDRVACTGTAYHAELVAVPRNLVVGVPDDVSLEDAAFVALGAIALQGVRQADVRIGERVAVVGLGLVGLITVQILAANGCRVIGLDIDPHTFDLARSLGCDDCVVSGDEAVDAVESFTLGHGTDAVVITASTQSSQPVELALRFARPQSRVVVVGAVGMEIPRSPFYEKELELRISRSYGPGRYDPLYEEGGVDYPIGYVRWTENRNMSAVLDLISAGRLDVASLVSHRFPIEKALGAYDLITGKSGDAYLGVLLEYPGAHEATRSRIELSTRVQPSDSPAVGFIGAGHFAQSYLLPSLAKQHAELRGVATATPVNARAVAEKFGFVFCTTDTGEVIGDNVDAVFITTRHDTHARFVIDALRAGRHVFVEKPLAVSREELDAVSEAATAAAANGRYLAVGFNRRFSRPVVDIAAFLGDRREPLSMTYTVNAGFIPRSSWVQADEQGGRIVGEGCHFLDVFAFLAGARPVRAYAAAAETENTERSSDDTVSIVVTYEDGSVGTLVYVANGSDRVPKEHLVVSVGGRTAVMRNFEEILFYGERSRRRSRYDGKKGHAEEVEHFLSVVRGVERPAFAVDELIATTAVSLAARESVASREAVVL